MRLERVEPYKININENLGDSSLIVNGSVSPYKLGKVVLKLQAGLFSNVVMPETVESLWGPVLWEDFRQELLITAQLLITSCWYQEWTAMFTVRVVHCQPLLMSCVQVFLRDQMMAVSHLVGTDQIPTHNLLWFVFFSG
ncbi:hypothetical protein EB796_010252 [Bugula neritina]|uniref:Uncharacterized protein n=1 Tax=Bugula neritina TaxID=10212 RepID=A0A7J7JZS8_BUGNE|nr:hypothetical protein EB796_010252 [Bugula neritina]